LCIFIFVLLDVDEQDCMSKLKAAKQREQEVIRQKSDNEAAFCQQRAKFIELFRQKEGEFMLISLVYSSSWAIFVTDLHCASISLL